jgi:hypothetical protein
MEAVIPERPKSVFQMALCGMQKAIDGKSFLQPAVDED